ncbi:MAG TPA: hypothetical protein VJ183_02180 [Chloroflexia bacterium]|nr:hypothetical protein [Chloroflexia bacterium]
MIVNILRGLRLRPSVAAAGLLVVMMLAALAVGMRLLRPANSIVPVPIAQPMPSTPTLLPPAAVSTGEVPMLPPPASTTEAYPTPASLSPIPTPKPLWDLHSLVFNASVVAEAQIIGSEKRPGSYTFIFYAHEWHKNEPGVKDNILRLTLDTSKNWDDLAYLPRNLIGNTDGFSPHKFMLFFGGTPNNYSILGTTAGIFFLREDAGVQTGAGAKQYENMPVKTFKEELRAILPATPTPLPPSATPLPTPADGSPISLVKVGDGYRVYPHRGIVRFGVGGMPSWLGPSRFQVLWSSGKAPYEGSRYLVDLQLGTIEKYNPPPPEWYAPYGSVPHPDGKRALKLIGATEDIWGVSYYDVATKQEQTVYDRDAAVPQWAGAEVHEPGLALSPGSPTWLSEDTFLLYLGASPATGEPHGKSRLLLVDASSHKIRVLAKEGGAHCPCEYGMPLLYQTGDISGLLLMLLSPYTGAPITLTSGGPWIRDWAATPDGRRVAWVEATAPPGDWAERLPDPCIPCERIGQRDPEPEVQAIAIWDSATGQVFRYKPDGLVWSLGSAYFMQWQLVRLHWRTDGSTLLYSTHTAGASGRSTLYSLVPGGQPEVLAEHQWDGSILFLGEGQDGSIYYWVTGRKYYASGDVVRRHHDGRLEVLHENLTSNMWWLEPGKWLEVIQEGAVTLHDFATSSARYARFYDHEPSLGELGWGGVQDLVPISPGGEWAAYASTDSDAVVITPDGIPDRGREMLIVRVK